MQGSIFGCTIKALYLAINMFLNTIPHSGMVCMLFFPSGKYLKTLFAILPSHLLLPVDWYQQYGWTEWGKGINRALVN